jgi:hypothetical protein
MRLWEPHLQSRPSVGLNSRKCLVCGRVDKANRPSQATFQGVASAFSGAADHIAARVIATRARAGRHGSQTPVFRPAR